MSLDTLQQENPIPRDATPVQGHTAADITSTTAVGILGTPSVAAKAYYVHEVILVNKTSAEDVAIELVDDTPTVYATLIPAKLTLGNGSYKFAKPLVIAAGKPLLARATASLGDTRVTAFASLGTPGLLG
jgi:hypothetical protein